MADNKSPLQAANLLNFLVGGLVTSPLNNNLYVGLSTTPPTAEGGNFTEPAGTTGYAKVPYPTGVSFFSEPVNRSCFNQQPIRFNNALTQYPTIVAIGLFDEIGSVVPLYFGHIDQGMSIEIGDALYFPPGKVIVKETQASFNKSDFLAHSQLKLLRNETFETPAEIYLALGTMPPTATGDIGELVASNSPGYIRVPIPCNVATWQITGRLARNLTEIVFPAAGVTSWESIKSFALHRSSTGVGNMLYCGSFGPNNTKVINSLDIARIPVAAITITE